MAFLSNQRGQQILEQLQKQGSASIQELAEALSVSSMTVHRDLNRLVAAGLVQKHHGNATLITSENSNGSKDGCAMCGKVVSERTAFVVSLPNGEHKRACCAHCGLMLHQMSNGTWQSMTADFLRDHMISATQAVYVIQSELTICCVPSVLSFGSLREAENFQRGFGGNLVNMEEALHHLHRMMHVT